MAAGFHDDNTCDNFLLFFLLPISASIENGLFKQGKTHGNELGIVLKNGQLISTMLETLEKIPYTEFALIELDWADPFIRENGHQPLVQSYKTPIKSKLTLARLVSELLK